MNADVAEILDRANALFEHRIALVSAFGKGGVVLMDFVRKLRLPIPVVFVNTGFLFPETVDFARDLAEAWGITMIEARPSRWTIGELGCMPWRNKPDECCQRAKVDVFDRALKPYRAWITAARRDQSPSREGLLSISIDKSERVKIAPLAAWTRDQVEQYIETNQLPVQPLHEKGYSSIGCVHCTSPTLPGEPERAGRWRGSAKNECGIQEG